MVPLYSLDINGLVIDEKLTITIRYLAPEYRLETMARFADTFNNNLKAVITHCCGKENQETTLSDIVHSDIDEDEIDGLTNLINEIQLN